MIRRPSSLLLALAASFIAGSHGRVSAQTADFASPAIEARVNQLLARMTVEEKVGQLNQLSLGNLTGPANPGDPGPDRIAKAGVGAVFNATTAHSTNEYQKQAVEATRLHIPLLFGHDVIHGFHTTFPIPLALSATWDPGLVQETARFAAVEASRQGVRWTFSPMVDIARDPRWGRIAEGAGEDPYLGAAFAQAYVRGYQGERLDQPDSILACAKHYVGYGAAEGGREYNTTEISERTLRDVYLPPFHAAVDAGVATIMSAFNALNGVPASANHFTLTTVLRDEWHFRGLVDSDWTSVREIMLHGIADDERTAAKKSFLAGVDMDMVSGIYLGHLAELVQAGEVPMDRLDEAVRRVLRLKFALGLFEHPYVPETSVAPSITPAGRALARRAAEESFVLLENRTSGGVPLLPLTPAPGRRIAVIGPLADSQVDMLGSWPGLGKPENAVTLKTALTARAAQTGMQVSFTPGIDIAGTQEPDVAAATAAARAADVVILTLGESGRSSGEASARAHLDLPGNQEQLLEAVVGLGKPTVLIVFSGRPLALTWASNHVPALLLAWFPGLEAGPALVRTLFGETAPTGRLTVSVPRYVGQVPIYYNSLNTGRPRRDPIGLGPKPADPYYVTGYLDEPNTALYPFGTGLTYTSFRYSGVRASAPSISAAALNAGLGQLTIGADVENSGQRTGTETVQLYIRLRGTSVARPDRELKGFERVTLAPGEQRHVEFHLGRQELAFWNIAMKQVVEPGSLYVWVAPDSASGTPVPVTLSP